MKARELRQFSKKELNKMLLKGFANVTPLLIIVLTIIIIFGIYFAFVKKSEPPIFQPTAAPNISPSQTISSISTSAPAIGITPASTPAPDETIEWKTYRNEEYGFEIKYPEDFTIKETFTFLKEVGPPFEYLEQFEYLDPVRIVKTFEILTAEEKIEIDIYRNANNLSINQWSDYIGNLELGYEGFVGGLRNAESVSMGGIAGLKGLYGCCGGCFLGVFIPKNNLVYALTLTGFASELCLGDDYVSAAGTHCCVKKDSLSIYNQILSTFRFIEE